MPREHPAKAVSLCGNCNCGLGLFHENKDIMLAAIAYIEKYEEGNEMKTIIIAPVLGSVIQNSSSDFAEVTEVSLVQ